MANRAKRSDGLKVKSWDGGDLKGVWEAGIKLDGVCVIIGEDGTAKSRADKPLYNVPPRLAPGIYECYLTSWETSISALRTQQGALVYMAAFYYLATLDGKRLLDRRLCLPAMNNPTRAEIRAALAHQNQLGREGLVLHQAGRYLRVKLVETYDVPVTGIQAGTGKHAGRMGALITPKGKVGTGFTDQQRRELMAARLDCEINAPTPTGGQIIIKARGEPLTIEVACMGLTPGGKFRHPRFVRVREDK